jgi:hypothetical protein
MEGASSSTPMEALEAFESRLLGTGSSTPVQALENLVLRAGTNRLQEAFCPNFLTYYGEETNPTTNCNPYIECIYYDSLEDIPDDPVVRRVDAAADARRLKGDCYQKSSLMRWVATSKLQQRGENFKVNDPLTNEHVCEENTREQALQILEDNANVDFRRDLKKTRRKADVYVEALLSENALAAFSLDIAERSMESLERLQRFEAAKIERYRDNQRRNQRVIQEQRSRYGRGGWDPLETREDILRSIGRYEDYEVKTQAYIYNAQTKLKMIEAEIARRREMEEEIERAQREALQQLADNVSEITVPSDNESREMPRNDTSTGLNWLYMMQNINGHPRLDGTMPTRSTTAPSREEAGLGRARARHNRDEDVDGVDSSPPRSVRPRRGTDGA